MKLILDTETTGLFKNGSKYTELSNFDNCRIVQLCMILTDDDYTIMEEYDLIIKCDFVISNYNIHGITNEISNLKGIPIENMSDILDDVLNRTDRIYIHNSTFDTAVICSELYRMNRLDVINKFMNIPIICSMKSTINYVRVYGKNKNYFKYPKLSELFLKLFNEELQHAHNCIYDVKNLLICLKKLNEIGFSI